MSKCFQIFLVGIFLSIVSCSEPTPPPAIKIIDSSTVKEKDILNEDSIRQAEYEEEDRINNIYMVQLLQKSQQVAYDSIDVHSFSQWYKVAQDTLYPISANLEYPYTVKIESGHFFSKNREHVIINRHDRRNFYIDVYLKDRKQLKKATSHEKWGLSYVSDTMQDVNGDANKDLLINWYGTNGCCLKAFTDVYLYFPETGLFSQQYEFINPTFSSNEKIIRGVKYGHPGETDMYKMRWSARGIDTIEYISYQKDEKNSNTGKVIRNIRFENNRKVNRVEILNAVPKEYREIFGYFWFTGEM